MTDDKQIRPDDSAMVKALRLQLESSRHDERIRALEAERLFGEKEVSERMRRRYRDHIEYLRSALTVEIGPEHFQAEEE